MKFHQILPVQKLIVALILYLAVQFNCFVFVDYVVASLVLFWKHDGFLVVFLRQTPARSRSLTLAKQVT